MRSNHPVFSFSARGPRALDIISGHSTENFGLGEQSPVARLYDLEASILLLGVGFEKNTSLHLCEYRATYPGKILKSEGAPVLVDGQRVWMTMQELDLDGSDFAALGEDFAAAGLVIKARVAKADVYLMKVPELVDFGVTWLTGTRGKGMSIGTSEPSVTRDQPTRN
jgi:aminoglycoside 3-N-acetyltransferase